MKIQTLSGTLRYQQDCMFLFKKAIAHKNVKMVKLTVSAVLVVRYMEAQTGEVKFARWAAAGCQSSCARSRDRNLLWGWRGRMKSSVINLQLNTSVPVPEPPARLWMFSWWRRSWANCTTGETSTQRRCSGFTFSSNYKTQWKAALAVQVLASSVTTR